MMNAALKMIVSYIVIFGTLSFPMVIGGKVLSLFRFIATLCSVYKLRTKDDLFS